MAVAVARGSTQMEEVLENDAAVFIDRRFFEYWEPPKLICTGGFLAVLESIAAVKYCPTRYTIFQPYTNKPFGVGIFDTLGKSWRKQWVLRLDTPHGGHNYHLNLNQKLTGVKDPHVEIPGSVVEAGAAATTAAKVVGYGALALAVCGDAYRLGCSMKEDYETNDTLIGKKTVKTGVTTAAGWGGGFLGAAGGSSSGAYVGGVIGAMFGGIGAAPGAAIGGIVGTLIGGVGGGVAGSLGAEVATDAVYNNIRINKKGFIFKVDENRHLCIIHNATPKTEKESECQYLQRVTEDWLKLLTDIVMLAYSNDAEKSTKILSVLTRLPVDEILAHISSDLVPLRYHQAYDQVFYESKFREIPVKRSIVHEICSSLAFFTSKVLFYIRSDSKHIDKQVLLWKKNYDCHEFLKNPVELIDAYKFPAIILDKKDNHILHFEDREKVLLPKELRKIQVKRDVKFILPKIQNEALVMDVTGKSLFWLNPKIGARAAAILIEKSFSDLEIISD